LGYASNTRPKSGINTAPPKKGTSLFSAAGYVIERQGDEEEVGVEVEEVGSKLSLVVAFCRLDGCGVKFPNPTTHYII
jgi:hypothetical protein